MDKINKNSFKELSPVRNSLQRMADAKNQPHIKQICGWIWQSNELHLLFSDTGLGKSLLAVVITNAITKGQKVMFLENENGIQIVLFYDFELTDRQFKKRYTNDLGQEYDFSSDLFIDTIDFASLVNANPQAEFTDLLFEKIKYDIEATKAQVLVIDNLTFLSTQTTQDTQIALEVMRRLNELKVEYNLSILVIAHTPKRDITKPITINDLAGSKNLGNFADSVSAIGNSTKGNSIRYWKQVKPSRSGELTYSTNNVIVYEITKQDNFLTVQFSDFGNEYDHLKMETKETPPPSQINEVINLLNNKKTYDEIATQLGISKGTITKWKKRYPEQFVSVSGVSKDIIQGNEETEIGAKADNDK